MVYTHLISVILPQTIDNLGCEGNLGQQEKHLAALPHHPVDEAYIHLRLARRGDAVQQRHGMGGAGEVVESSLLLFVKAYGLRVGGGVVVLQPRLLVSFEMQDAVFYESAEGRIGERAPAVGVHQHPFGHRRGPILAEPHKLQHHVHLLGGVLLLFKRVEKLLSSEGVAVLLVESHILRRAWHEALVQLLVQHDNLALNHGVDDGHHLLHTDGAADVVDRHHRVVGQQLHDTQLVVGEVGQLACEVGVDGQRRLAG